MWRQLLTLGASAGAVLGLYACSQPTALHDADAGPDAQGTGTQADAGLLPGPDAGGWAPDAAGEPSSISGAVTGATAAGVTIALSGASARSTTTGGNGSYSFTGIANGSYTLTPSKTGYQFSPPSIAVTVNDSSVTGQDFAATALTYGISGTVTGATTAGVTIALGGESMGSNTTDGSGSFTFSGLTVGKYTLTPTATGYRFSPANLTVVVSGSNVTGQDFVDSLMICPVTHGIFGSITGAVAAGVTISLGGAATTATMTDGSGNYGFNGLADGNYTVTPSANGYAFSPPSLAVTVNGTNASGQTFAATSLPKRYGISGTVSGDAAAAVTITLTGSATGSTFLDETGRYSFTGLANGNYTLTPGAGGYAFLPPSLAVTVNGSDITGQDFAKAFRISGTVSGATGAGVKGGTVTLGGSAASSTTTDGSGGYSFIGLANGNYTLTPSATGYVISPLSLAVTVNGSDVAGQDFTATAPTQVSISGTISGATGPCVTISLDGAATASLTTHGSGNFSFAGLADGAYMLTPQQAGYAFSPPGLAVTVNGSNITGQNFTATALAGPHNSVSGTISGATTTGVRIQINSGGSTIVDASGNFCSTGLPDGNYTVTPSDCRYAFSPASAAVTLNNSNVTGQDFAAAVTTTHDISGRVIGAGAGVTISLSGEATGATATDGSGSYRFTGLANCSYTLTPGDSEYLFSPPSLDVTVNGTSVTKQDFVACASKSFPGVTNRTLHSAWGSATSDVWAVGNAGTILRWDGTIWSTTSSGTTKALYGVWGSSANDVWAVGDAILLHWNGSTWADAAGGCPCYLRAVWGSSATDVWTVGSAVMHWNGSAWSSVPVPAAQHGLVAVWGSSSNDVWAVSADGPILHWDGCAWSCVSSAPGGPACTWIPNLYPFGIWGSSPNDVLVPAQEFLIEFYKWDGKSWSRMITSNDFSRGTAGGVWGISANEVWAVGWGDNILHWNGSRWARVSSGSPNGLTSVWGSHSSTDVWAVGDRGTILHWYR